MMKAAAASTTYFAISLWRSQTGILWSPKWSGTIAKVRHGYLISCNTFQVSSKFMHAQYVVASHSSDYQLTAISGCICKLGHHTLNIHLTKGTYSRVEV